MSQELEEGEIVILSPFPPAIKVNGVALFSFLLQGLLRYPEILLFQGLLGFSPVVSLSKVKLSK